jgi:EmrB/QacA subfamily drug resistance transporter
VTAPSSAATATPLLTRRQINLIVVGLVIGMFMSALDQMIVSTAIRTIGDDLNGLTLQAWVTTAYLIAATISTPLYGKLSDIYGRKPLYVISISLFVVGSLLCGTATDMYQLAAYRGVQGLGAGGLMALALIILGDILSPRERTKYQAAFFGVWGLASVLGPVLGGFFAGAETLFGFAGWRWIFLMNVPLGIVTLFVILRTLHLPHLHKTVKIDWWGVVTLVVALVPLLIVVEQGRKWGWTSPTSLAFMGLALAGIIGFYFAERAAKDDALLPLRMFRNRTVGLSTGMNLVMGFAMFGGLAGLPLYLQISKGMSPTEAGLAMLPFTAGILLMATVSARVIQKTGHYKMFPVVGISLLTIAGLYLSTLSADSPLWHMAAGAVVFGAGLGSVMQPNMLAVQNAVEPRDMGTGSASVMFFRQIGGSLGTAVFLSILFSSVSGYIAEEFGKAAQTPEFQQVIQDPEVLADPVNAAVVGVITSGSLEGAEEAGLSLDDTSFIQELHPVLAQPFEEGFAAAITHVILISSFITAAGLIFAIMIPQLPLREKSGLETLRDGDHELTEADQDGDGVPDAEQATAELATGSEPGPGKEKAKVRAKRK